MGKEEAGGGCQGRERGSSGRGDAEENEMPHLCV